MTAAEALCKAPRSSKTPHHSPGAYQSAPPGLWDHLTQRQFLLEGPDRPASFPRNFQRVSARALGSEVGHGFLDAADLLAGCSVSASSPAPRGDGPGPDLQRLHWPTAARRSQPITARKMRQRRTLRAGQALALGTSFLWLSSEFTARAPWQKLHIRNPP